MVRLSRFNCQNDPYEPSESSPSDDEHQATSESPNFRDANTGRDEDETASDVDEGGGSAPRADVRPPSPSGPSKPNPSKRNHASPSGHTTPPKKKKHSTS